MTLDFNTVLSAVRGTAQTQLEDGKLWLYRFTDAQSEAYRAYSSDFFKKSKATAGIRLEFSTNSTSLCLEGECFVASSRNFYNFDVYINGSLVCHTLKCIEQGYAEYQLKVNLGNAEKKHVRIYFPWSAQANITAFSIDDSAYFTPTERPYKMICFGDSITHGYDAYNPSFSYTSRLADMLCADHINKGIGGEQFFPTLSDLKDDFEPDYITVAYGTNDWAVAEKANFDKNVTGFYQNLSKNYPNATIFALAPVWRINCETRVTSVGKFTYVANKIKEIANTFPNVVFIDCIDFIPHEQAYYSTDVLHPNDAGFSCYAAALFAEIKKHI